MHRNRTWPLAVMLGRTQRNRILPIDGNASEARRQLQGLTTGRSYLDIIVIGDSNGGFDGTTASRGFSGGWWETLLDASQFNTKEYGTGLGEASGVSAGGFFPLNGANGENTTSQFSVSIIGSAGGTVWGKGSALASGTLDSIYYQGTSGYELYFPGRVKDFAYLVSTASSTYEGTWVALNTNASYPNALNSDMAATCRFNYAVPAEAGVTPRFVSWVYRSVGGDVAAQTTHSVPNVTEDIVLNHVDRSWAAGSGRGKIYGVFAANTTSRGPLAMLFRSFFRSGTPGFSLTNLTSYGGASPETIGKTFSDDLGCKYTTIKTYLKVLVDRQRTAGGDGEILVFVNMGTNGTNPTTTSPMTYPVAARTIINQFKKAWAELGYATTRLNFVFTATAAWTDYNPEPTYSALVSSLSGIEGVCCVNINKFAPQSYLVANSMYAGTSATPQAHLSPAGYKDVARKIIQEILSN